MSNIEPKSEYEFYQQHKQDMERRQAEREGLRDHFAGLAMQGFASNTEWSRTVNDDWDDYVERMTTGAYEIADAMLKARKEVKP